MESFSVVIELFAIVSFMLMAGLYFIFSNTIMKVLSQLPNAQGAKVMAKINDVIINPVFFVFFFGSALSAAYLVYDSLFVNREIMTFAAGTIFVLGSFLSTVLFNVPLNNRLKHAVDNKVNLETVWLEYLRKWTKWNHLRAIVSLVSAIILII